MKNKGPFYIFLCIIVAVLAGCGHDEDEELGKQVDSFATAYFNWQFPRCRKYVTDSSQVWLRYLSSQVNEMDVDTLRARETGATVEIGTIDLDEDGSSATVAVTVCDVLMMDTIGHVGHLVDQQDYVIPVVRERGKWKVRLTSPLRPQ